MDRVASQGQLRRPHCGGITLIRLDRYMRPQSARVGIGTRMLMGGIAEDSARGEAWKAGQLRWLARAERRYRHRMRVVHVMERVALVRGIVPRRRAIRRARVANAAATSSRGESDPPAAPLTSSTVCSGMRPSRGTRRGVGLFSAHRNATAGRRSSGFKGQGEDETLTSLFSQ